MKLILTVTTIRVNTVIEGSDYFTDKGYLCVVYKRAGSRVAFFLVWHGRLDDDATVHGIGSVCDCY